MGFVFADSPQGGGHGGSSDGSEHRPWLLHTAKRKTTAGPATRAADPDRLLEEVASEANLARALLNVVRNKGAPGVDGQTVEEAEAQAPRLLADLRRDLLAGRFRPGDIRRVWIPKPGGGERGLGIPNVVTRVVQQAMLQVLEPIYEPTFHPSSHGFRPNRGAHTALAEARVSGSGLSDGGGFGSGEVFRPGSSSALAGSHEPAGDRPTDPRPGTPNAEGCRGDAGRHTSRRRGRRTARGSTYASYNLAKLPFELGFRIERERLRPGYGDGFHGAPLVVWPASGDRPLENGGADVPARQGPTAVIDPGEP
jgi:Reverse transcriptase (RNA-dependent DNA polymerase)